MLEIQEDIITSEGIFMKSSPSLVFLSSEFIDSEYQKFIMNIPPIYGKSQDAKGYILNTLKGKLAINPDGKELFLESSIYFIGEKYIIVKLDSITYKLLDMDFNEIIPKIIGMSLFFHLNSCVIVTAATATPVGEENIVITPKGIYKAYGDFYNMLPHEFESSLETAEKIEVEDCEKATTFKDNRVVERVIREKLKEMFPEYAGEFQESLVANVEFLESKGINLVFDTSDFSLKKTKFQKVLKFKNQDKIAWIPLESADLDTIESFVRERKKKNNSDKK